MIIDDIRAWFAAMHPTKTVIIAPYRGTTPDGTVVDGPAPSGDYISIQEMTSKGSVNPSIERSNIVGNPGNILFEAQNFIQKRISVNVYASDGEGVLHAVESDSKLPPVRLSDDVTFRPIIVDSGEVRALHFLNDTHHAYRYQCEFTINSSYTRTRIDPRVNSVSISGDFAGMDSSVEQEF